MFLNNFASTAVPLDMTQSDEFRSLLASAADLGIPHAPAVPYRSRNIVLRQIRFHYLEWGDAGCAADRAAARRPPVGAFLGPGQPASGAALSRAGAGPARPRRQRMAARRRIHQRRDVAGCRGVHRRAGPAPADPDRPFDGRPQCDAADPARSVAPARAGDRRCRAGTVGSRPRGHRRLRAGQPGIRRPGTLRRERAEIRSLPQPGAHRAHGEIQHAATRRREVRQQVRCDAAAAGAGARAGTAGEHHAGRCARASICRCCWCAAPIPAS